MTMKKQTSVLTDRYACRNGNSNMIRTGMIRKRNCQFSEIV